MHQTKREIYGIRNNRINNIYKSYIKEFISTDRQGQDLFNILKQKDPLLNEDNLYEIGCRLIDYINTKNEVDKNQGNIKKFIEITTKISCLDNINADKYFEAEYMDK